MSGKVILYLARHGETVGNIDRVLYHPNEDVLSENGKRQAGLLGKHLENVKFTRVFTSDYPRAVETASIVLQHQNPKSLLRDEDIKQDKRLRERFMGTAEGNPYAPLLAAMIASGKSIHEFSMPESETFKDMKARMMDFFQKTLHNILTSKAPNEDEAILVVSHGYLLNRFMTKLKKEGGCDITGAFIVRGWEERCRRIMSNCSYMQLKVSRDEATGKVCLTFQKIHQNEHLGSDITGRNDALLKIIASNTAASVLSECIQA